MLELIKKALRITTDAFDDELTHLMDSAIIDLGFGGMDSAIDLDSADPVVTQAVITYCKMNFGLPDDYDRLKKSYDEQKAQLGTATNYTIWSANHV